MDDLISRQAVQEMVDRIGGMYPYKQIGNRDSYSQYNEAWTDAINRVDAELSSLPSAQPERKKGKWIDIMDADEYGEPYPCGVECDNCGFQSTILDNFCPNCGADMRGEE